MFAGFIALGFKKYGSHKELEKNAARHLFLVSLYDKFD